MAVMGENILWHLQFALNDERDNFQRQWGKYTTWG